MNTQSKIGGSTVYQTKKDYTAMMLPNVYQNRSKLAHVYSSKNIKVFNKNMARRQLVIDKTIDLIEDTEQESQNVTPLTSLIIDLKQQNEEKKMQQQQELDGASYHNDQQTQMKNTFYMDQN